MIKREDFYYLMFLLARWGIEPGIDGYQDFIAMAYSAVDHVLDGCQLDVEALIYARASKIDSYVDDLEERMNLMLKDLGIGVDCRTMLCLIGYMGGKRL